eukprot:131265_1
MVDITRMYFDIPMITRTYLTFCLLTTLGCYMELISPYSLYFNVHFIFKQYQFWRLFTNFFFFGSTFGLDLFFHMFFLARYSRRLEEETFAGRTGDFVYMIILGSILMLFAAPIVSIPFLGSSLTFMLVYIWSKRNPWTQLQFIGLMNFTAPWLPWVLLGLSLLLGHDVTADLLGIVVGHCYYFTKWIYPEITHPNKIQLIQTPRWIQYLFMERDGYDVINMNNNQNDNQEQVM